MVTTPLRQTRSTSSTCSHISGVSPSDTLAQHLRQACSRILWHIRTTSSLESPDISNRLARHLQQSRITSPTRVALQCISYRLPIYYSAYPTGCRWAANLSNSSGSPLSHSYTQHTPLFYCLYRTMNARSRTYRWNCCITKLLAPE